MTPPKVPAPLVRAGRAFEMTHAGIVELGGKVAKQDLVTLARAPLGAVVGEVRETVTTVTTSHAPPIARSGFDPSRPLTGKDLLGHITARIAEIDRQLRNVPALQSERAQLGALLLAASPKKRRAAPAKESA